MIVRLVLTLAASIPATMHDAPPIHFGTSGGALHFPVSIEDGEQVTTEAFGQQVGEPLTIQDGHIDFALPEVRALTVFELKTVTTDAHLVASVAVYPQGTRLWNEESVHVAALAAPEWFLEWSAAVGIPVQPYPSELAVRQSIPRGARHRVIVVGRTEEVDTPQAAIRLGKRCNANVVALDATWYANRVDGPVEFKGDKPPAVLGRLGDWSWRPAPSFSMHDRPAAVVMNRAVGAADGDEALVEVLFEPGEAHVLVASYVPWWEQLGRSDRADAFLGALILETARAPAAEPFDGAMDVRGVDGRWPDRMRPVLSRAVQASKDAARETRLVIVDLRGSARSRLTARDIRSWIESDDGIPVLVLGDDPVLRSVRNLPSEDSKKRSAGGCIWLRSDELPPTQVDAEKLQRILTENRIPIDGHAETR